MFTREQIEEIARALQSTGAKDSSFPVADKVTGDEDIIILKDRLNYRAKFSSFYEYLSNNLIKELKDTIAQDFQKILDSIAEVAPEVEESLERYFTQTIMPQVQALQNNVNAHTDTVVQNAVNSVLEALSAKEDSDITITVTGAPEGAVVHLNGTEQTSITVKYGTLVVIKVTLDGYSPYNAIVPAYKTQTIAITLDEAGFAAIYCKFTVEATPADATVTIDGEPVTEVTVPMGSSVHVKVEKSGYDTYEQDIQVTELEQKLEVVLVEATEVSLANLDLMKADDSEIDPSDIPYTGGQFKFKATADITYSNGEVKNEDVTNRVIWSIEDSGSQNGLTSNGGGLFTMKENTGRNVDNYTITGKITSDNTIRLLKKIYI